MNIIRLKSVFTEEHLIEQFKIASRGKRYHSKLIKIYEDRLYRLYILRGKLLNGEYTPGKDRVFTIYEPKMRIVRANDFYSKIVQGILVNYVIIPCVEKTLIDDNYASRKGFGTKAAFEKLYSNLRSAYINYGNSNSNVYVLKCDIRKYFDNVSIDILLQMIDHLPIDNQLKKSH